MERLDSSSRLGSYPDRDEFQVGKSLAWIMIPEDGKRTDWLEREDGLFDDLWRDRDRVLAFAQPQSRAAVPDFWAAHDLADTSAEQLAVWGLWIDPENGSAVYEISQNHGFGSDLTDLPEYPENVWVMVRRDARGVLSLYNPATQARCPALFPLSIPPAIRWATRSGSGRRPSAVSACRAAPASSRLRPERWTYTPPQGSISPAA